MPRLIEFFIWYAVLIFWTAFVCLWMWFMLKRPQQWAAWVDKENDFWVRIGLCSKAFAERSKHWEKGLPLKSLVGIISVIGTSSVVFFGGWVLKYFLFKK